MSLVLGVGIGESVYADDTAITLVSVEDKNNMVVSCQGKEFRINDERSIVVCKGVSVSVGKGTVNQHRLCFTANKSIKLLRESLYVKVKSDLKE